MGGWGSHCGPMSGCRLGDLWTLDIGEWGGLGGAMGGVGVSLGSHEQLLDLWMLNIGEWGGSWGAA